MVRNKIANISFALLMVVAVLISGCDFGTNSGKGTLEVRLHDNPGDFDDVQGLHSPCINSRRSR